MTGGLIQIVATGSQDQYLTCRPEITFFKILHKRHTNFSIETIEHSLNNIDFGKNTNVQILRNGDLCTKMYLKIKLNAVKLALQHDHERLSVAWVRKLGHALIKYVEVDIGGTKIDKHYGTWLDIWYELTHQNNHEKSYSNMIGDIPELTQLKPVTSTVEKEIIGEHELLVPLQFWFNRNYGLALPLIALQFHDVRLFFEFEEIHKLVIHSGDAQFDLKKFSMKDASLLVDYIYLDVDERKKFAQYGHEYLIEQVQFEGIQTVQGSGSGKSISDKFDLGFNHPTKELIWVLKNGAFNGESSRNFCSLGNRFLTYTHDDNQWEKALDYAAENIARGMILFEEPTNDDVEYITHDVSKQNPYITYKENGYDLTVKFQFSEYIESSIRVYIILNPLVENGCGKTYNLGKFIHRFNVLLTCESNEIIGYDVHIKKHNLNLNDVSIPLIDWTDYRSTTVNGINKYDVTVIQESNYGVRLDGKGNPIHEANIHLNGHDRFKLKNGNYFNYLQTYQHHTHSPADGINIYSFAIYPEQFQPSGSVNLSRIDKTQLNIKFSDPYRANKNIPQLNLSRDSKFFVFALSSNIFRAYTGMGGCAYNS